MHTHANTHTHAPPHTHTRTHKHTLAHTHTQPYTHHIYTYTAAKWNGHFPDQAALHTHTDNQQQPVGIIPRSSGFTH